MRLAVCHGAICLLAAIVPLAGVAQSAHAQRSRDQVSLVFQGESALQRQEIPAAIAAFREAARDSSARRRAAAERMLGLIEWRIYRRFSSAHEHLARAHATQMDTAATLIEEARLAAAERRFVEAYALASRAHASARDDFAERGSALQMAHAVIEPAFSTRVDGQPMSDGEAPDSAARAGAVATLLRLVRQTPGRTDDARSLLLVALLHGDGMAAAEALNSYYLVRVGAERGSWLPTMMPRLAKQLVAWRGSRATTSERARLAAALAAARLHDAASLVAPSGSELTAYGAYCRRISREAQEYYRRALLGEARPEELTRLYYRASRDLWPRLAWPATGPPRFYPAAVGPELARRFGTVIQLGITGGYYDLHMGHVVGEQLLDVAQYGARARLRLLVIDGMVSNGLQTWAWDEAGGHGGWQRRDTVVQVRPVFVEHTIALWLTADSTRHERELVTTAFDSIADWSIAADDSIGYLPGVSARFRRDGRDALLDSLRRAGLGGPALAATFIRVASRLSYLSSIVAHEGRHAIDDALLVPHVTTEEREFRAKLSEVAFADRPKLVFSSIMHPNIGDATPHGRANARIMSGLIRWMRERAPTIQGIDTSRPMLPQLPLLTDDQLRQAFRSMDPLAPRR